jgi:putative nucleotidyltransferase with HDIG domain
MVYGVAEAMGRIVEVRDPYTQGHEVRVAKLAKLIAEEMHLTEDEVEAIEMSGLVHDIGKLCVPAEILTKPGKLIEEEFALIRKHSEAGYSILKGIEFPWAIAEIVLAHHERMDGSGYPGGLLEVDIPLASRVLAVADVAEAMASHRPYRAALGLDAAMSELTGNSQMYDADVVAAFLALYESGRVDFLPQA